MIMLGEYKQGEVWMEGAGNVPCPEVCRNDKYQPKDGYQPLVRLIAQGARATKPPEFRPISVTDSLHRLYSKLLLQMLCGLHPPKWLMHQLGRR